MAERCVGHRIFFGKSVEATRAPTAGIAVLELGGRCRLRRDHLRSGLLQVRDLIVIGGGIAGLTAAIDVAQSGYSVVVIEKGNYPRHKICGEYISNEIVPYYGRLGIPLRSWQPQTVERFRLHAPSGKWVETKLPLGGFGLRRFTLEEHLYRIARDHGVEFVLNTTVRQADWLGDGFSVRGPDGIAWQARSVIGGFGKQSELDRQLERPRHTSWTDYLAVKFYVEGEFPRDLVCLYNFEHGYAGAVQVEDTTVDVAYMTCGRQVRRFGDLDTLEKSVLHRNPALRALLTESKRLDARPHVISNISLRPKEQVRQHILMIGDAAGMIPPLCGNGMAMAVHGAKLAAEATTAFLSGKLTREEGERRFATEWRRRFARRLSWGRRLQRLMEHERVSESAVWALRLVPGVLPRIISRTHGLAFS